MDNRWILLLSTIVVIVIVHNLGLTEVTIETTTTKAKYSERKQQKTKGFSSEQKQQNNKKQNISHFNKKHKKAKDVS